MITALIALLSQGLNAPPEGAVLVKGASELLIHQRGSAVRKLPMKGIRGASATDQFVWAWNLEMLTICSVKSKRQWQLEQRGITGCAYMGRDSFVVQLKSDDTDRPSVFLLELPPGKEPLTLLPLFDEGGIKFHNNYGFLPVTAFAVDVTNHRFFAGVGPDLWGSGEPNEWFSGPSSAVDVPLAARDPWWDLARILPLGLMRTRQYENWEPSEVKELHSNQATGQLAGWVGSANSGSWETGFVIDFVQREPKKREIIGRAMRWSPTGKYLAVDETRRGMPGSHIVKLLDGKTLRKVMGYEGSLIGWIPSRDIPQLESIINHWDFPF
ncbi:MAG: hypothetical protein JSS72_05875 [Armatimonadetes bacterium]|nr:hypothetical protein [Armatimonadota bacterium]